MESMKCLVTTLNKIVNLFWPSILTCKNDVQLEALFSSTINNHPVRYVLELILVLFYGEEIETQRD